MTAKAKSQSNYMREYMRVYRRQGKDTYYKRHKAFLNKKTPCPICNKCISRQNLKRHIRQIH